MGQWCVWRRLAIKVNDDIKKKDLVKMIHFPPILDNIVADMLSILIDRAKSDGQISSYAASSIIGCYSSLYES